MLIQAYDFWHLWKSEGCELQMGGSDQWGNITAGTELISRKEGASAHGLTLPLLTTAAGTKFGKTEGGAVWLDPAKTSPYKFFQFWLNTDDRDVERLLKFFTFFPVDEVASLMGEQARDPGKRPAQRRLAEDMTARVHGPATARSVVEASRLLFGATDLRAAGADVLAVLAEELPVTRLARTELEGLPVLDALVRAGLATSKSDARRGIAGKGFLVNGETIAVPERTLGAADLLHGAYVMLQKGKRNHALVVVS
jgi:tyrosyl-tRNA synthetase